MALGLKAANELASEGDPFVLGWLTVVLIPTWVKPKSPLMNICEDCSWFREASFVITHSCRTIPMNTDYQARASIMGDHSL
jgi:hypothetical protein